MQPDASSCYLSLPKAKWSSETPARCGRPPGAWPTLNRSVDVHDLIPRALNWLRLLLSPGTG
ncbi:hypothetical protein FNH08_30155, partial [Streptomyces spongiae]|nr:hypothetical protein [Streptomyces spongiae]